MTEYYFDIETTGKDPLKDKIITIQWQELDRYTGEPVGDPMILKEWESSEKEILSSFLPKLTTEDDFAFTMIGQNLLFDFCFISHKAKIYGLKELNLQFFKDRAFIDLKPILIMINEGRFKGYNKLIPKKLEFINIEVPRLYEKGRYSEILTYIQEETTSFLKIYQILKKEMPSLKAKLR